MKSSVVVIALLAVSLQTCQDTKEELKSIPAKVSYYTSIGKQIPFETGMRWMDFYKKKNNQNRRLGIPAYTISASKLELVLHSISSIIGVAFHYGTDEIGNKHILIIPVDQSLSLWSPLPGRIFVDANTGNEVNQSVAKAWAEKYQNAHPNEIWFHFFGKNIFDEIVTISYFNSIDIEPALNDLNLTPQLLLIIWNDLAILGGRTSVDNCRVYDASNACPPCEMQ